MRLSGEECRDYVFSDRKSSRPVLVPGIGILIHMSPIRDKQNKVDFRWFIVRTLPHQEKKVAGMLERHKQQAVNILEVYCPTHTTVGVRRGNREETVPLFAGFVFVFGTQQAVSGFLAGHYPDGVLLYGRVEGQDGKSGVLTVPEEQMRAFMDFNENYADRLVILERPFSDYAFNPMTGEPNEIVRVVDGPLAGREGYLARFRRDKRLVFRMKALGTGAYYTVSIPHVWDFHVVRLHNAEGDRQTMGTVKERAVDLLAGILQGCGYGEKTLPMLYDIVDRLAAKPSLAGLCRALRTQGDEDLAGCIAGLEGRDAELILNLVRYERDTPGYVKNNWKKLVIRPFLTPTSGVGMEAGCDEATLRHEGFTETIRRVDITEEAYYPSLEENRTVTAAYYAHIGTVEDKEKGNYTLFANWDTFLGEYFLTVGKANEKLVGGTTGRGKGNPVESFRNYAPTLYRILTNAGSPVKAIQGFSAGGEMLNVMALTTTDVDKGKDELIRTCTDICKEISTTAHLAVWRRYLRTVWLHR